MATRDDGHWTSADGGALASVGDWPARGPWKWHSLRGLRRRVGPAAPLCGSEVAVEPGPSAVPCTSSTSIGAMRDYSEMPSGVFAKALSTGPTTNLPIKRGNRGALNPLAPHSVYLEGNGRSSTGRLGNFGGWRSNRPMAVKKGTLCNSSRSLPAAASAPPARSTIGDHEARCRIGRRASARGEPCEDAAPFMRRYHLTAWKS
jgi:hypothetical protein